MSTEIVTPTKQCSTPESQNLGDNLLPPMPSGVNIVNIGPSATRYPKAYVQENTGTITAADIASVVGGSVRSITIKQIAGTGVIMGSAGSGSSMNVGESWSWSVDSSVVDESLSNSGLSFNAGIGGVQRITALYL